MAVSNLRPIYTRAQVENLNLQYWDFDTWNWQALIQISKYWSCTNLQALNSLSNCKVAKLKVRYQGGYDTKQRNIHDSQRMLESPLPTSPQNESLIFNIPRLCHSPFTWDPSRHFLSTVTPKKVQTLKWKAQVLSRLEWTTCVKGSPLMRRLPSSKAQPL